MTKDKPKENSTSTNPYLTQSRKERRKNSLKKTNPAFFYIFLVFFAFFYALYFLFYFNFLNNLDKVIKNPSRVHYCTYIDDSNVCFERYIHTPVLKSSFD